ncbi:MAG: hypothetical protein QM820_00670 [Minicystis sp.]
MLLKRLLAFAAVLACSRAARAETPPPAMHRVDVDLLAGVRLVHPFTLEESYGSPFVAYGYRDLRFYVDLNAAASYRVHRYVDLGGRVSWLYGGRGSNGADGSLIQVFALEAMGFVRPFFRGDSDRAGVGIELAAGVQGGWITLRGEVVARASYVVAPTLVAFLASTRVQPALRMGPVFARLRDALGGLDVATSGLSVTVGGNLAL